MGFPYWVGFGFFVLEIRLEFKVLCILKDEALYSCWPSLEPASTVCTRVWMSARGCGAVMQLRDGHQTILGHQLSRHHGRSWHHHSLHLLVVMGLHGQPHPSVTQMLSLAEQIAFQEKFLIRDISPGSEKGMDCYDIGQK